VPPSRIDDGYCDCPLDGSDEPGTGACSGSVDGMWAGVPPKHESSNYDAAHRPSQYFSCAEQPSLKLPPSRVNDGICDCCDGSDEAPSSFAKCPDVCDEVMAEERAARAKAQSAFAFGSKSRMGSIAQYNKWHDEKTRDLRRLKDVDLRAADKELGEVEKELTEAKVMLAEQWLNTVYEQVLVAEPLAELVGDESAMSADDLASFVLSLCALSAEISSGNVANDRCVALDRASSDVGILWKHVSDGDDDSLPVLEPPDSGSEAALVDFAERIVLRLEGKDTVPSSSSSRGGNKINNERTNKSPPLDSYDSEDDPYGDDWEDRPDYDYTSDDDSEDHSHDGEEEGESLAEDEANVEEPQLTENQLLVKSLLDKVPLDRTLFKEQGKLLLEFTLGAPNDEGKEGGDESLEESASDEGANEGGEESNAGGDVNGSVDPMALQMTKSAISKRLSNISHGETAAQSAARYVASLMKGATLGDLRNVAIMTIYHSGVAAGDVAELIYATSSGLRSTEAPSSESVNDGKSSCSPPWSTMCPPRTVSLQSGVRTYPPSFISEAAKKRCEERERLSAGVCYALAGESELMFPTTVADGYYNYYEPQSRDGSEDDSLVPYFSSIHFLHEKVPSYLSSLLKRKESLDKKKKTLLRKVSEIESELGDEGGGSMYGPDGELYALRDVCLKIESGKYEYELCIFGGAKQRDHGQTSGGTNLGSWEKLENDEEGRRTLRWGGGTKCWNGPQRSAEASVTCGAETKLLTADEPETCRYAFTMESPIGCDEQFKLKKSL